MTGRIPVEIVRIIEILEAHGHEAYLVGGCVRDRLLGCLPADYDVCTSALPEEMKSCFAGRCKVFETGIRHGTLTVLYKGVPCEVTTFRLDGNYTDGRHPDSVVFASRVEEDLSRRDFTINAMASAHGALIDPFGGRSDLANGFIRSVGDARDRFSEDALRILRALRFASRLDFRIEHLTENALRAEKDRLSRVSRERIASELTGIVMGKAAERITREYADVIAAAIPHPAVVSDILPFDEVIRLAALCVNSEDAVRSLKLSNRRRDAILSLITNMDRALPSDEQEALRLLQTMGSNSAYLLCQLRGDQNAAQCIKDAQKSGVPYQVRALAVNGTDLLNIDVPREQIGKTLEKILSLVIGGKLSNKKAEILNAVRQDIPA